MSTACAQRSAHARHRHIVRSARRGRGRQHKYLERESLEKKTGKLCVLASVEIAYSTFEIPFLSSVFCLLTAHSSQARRHRASCCYAWLYTLAGSLRLIVR